MDTEKALLAAIWDQPHDDTARLVYADWLEETGDPAKVAGAEFIRVQCELARLDVDDSRHAGLERRQNELHWNWRAAWNKTLRREARNWRFRRGFPQPNDGKVRLDHLLKMPRWKLRTAPTRLFLVSDTAQRLDDFLAWPGLDRLETFCFELGMPPGDWLSRVGTCPGLRNVRRVCLLGCPIRLDHLDSLLTAWGARGLVLVSLNGTRIGDDGLRLVLNHPAIRSIRGLEFHDCGIGPAGVRALAGSRYHPQDADLALNSNPIGDEGLFELLKWPGLRRIQRINLWGTRITDAGAMALANSENVQQIRTLWLSGNAIGAAGAAALADSPHFQNLTQISLNYNPLPESALVRLRQRFGRKLSEVR